MVPDELAHDLCLANVRFPVGPAVRGGLRQAHPRIVPVHGPVRASWLNQRKAFTPNNFPCLETLAERLSNFERYFESIARPFEWKFTRVELNALIARMRSRYSQSQHLKMAA